MVVGFDLDMTLIDSRPGVAATLESMVRDFALAIDVDEVCARLGSPLDQLLAPYVEAERIPGLVDTFRARYPDHAITASRALPGAHEALDSVRTLGGRRLVVTGKFTANARRHLDALALDVEHLVGDVWGAQKGPVLVEHGATVYVGDHVHDVAGAHAAGALSVSVLTGGCTEAELLAAGTDVVLASLSDFPDWWEEHVLDRRLDALASDLRSLGSVLVAYSGGADSAMLLAAAVQALGPDQVAAGTGYSDSLPLAERSPAHNFAEGLGVRVLTPATHEMDRAGYRANAGDRCYFCKAELLDVLGPLAQDHGLAHVATGTNADDLAAGFRPGIRAAQERGARTPLADAGLSKDQVRAASRRWGLPTWDKPAAACLSSRIAYGVEVTPFRLGRVERAEVAARAALDAHDLEVRNLRVRDLGQEALLEVDAVLVEQIAAFPDVLAAVRLAGFARVGLDPAGFRSGSLTERLVEPERYR